MADAEAGNGTTRTPAARKPRKLKAPEAAGEQTYAIRRRIGTEHGVAWLEVGEWGAARAGAALQGWATAHGAELELLEGETVLEAVNARFRLEVPVKAERQLTITLGGSA